MGKIEEIKERIKAANEQGTASDEWRDLEVEAYRNITYLLSRLQIAGQALDEIRCREDPYAMINIAEEALEQIRENPQ